MNRFNVLTAWIVADLETEQGREALLSAVSHVKTSSLLRVGVIHNGAKVGTVTKIVQAALDTFDSKAAKLLLLKVSGNTTKSINRLMYLIEYGPYTIDNRYHHNRLWWRHKTKILGLAHVCRLRRCVT